MTEKQNNKENFEDRLRDLKDSNNKKLEDEVLSNEEDVEETKFFPGMRQILQYKRYWIPAAAVLFTLGLLIGWDRNNKKKDKEGYQAEKQALVSKIDSLEKEKNDSQYVDSLIERGIETAKNEEDLDSLVEEIRKGFPDQVKRTEFVVELAKIRLQNDPEKINDLYKAELEKNAGYKKQIESLEAEISRLRTSAQIEKDKDLKEDESYKMQIRSLQSEIDDYRIKLASSEDKIKSLEEVLQKDKDNNSAEKKEYERRISELEEDGIKKNDGDHIVVYALDGLFLTDLKGTAPKNLTEGTSLHNIRNPRISPDKKKIIFNAGGSLAPDRNITVVEGIYSINTDGSDVKMIREGAAFMPQWTPDGKKISYYVLPENAEGDNTGVLALFDCESQKESWLLKNVNIDEYAWSNNSKYIVYNFKKKSYLARVDRNLKIRFTNLLRASLNPVFSPDDENIIHSLSGNLCYTDLFSVISSSDGTEEVRNCSPINFIRTNSEEIERMPRCSGNEVVFFQTTDIKRKKLATGGSILVYSVYVKEDDYPPNAKILDSIDLEVMSYLVSDSDIKNMISMIEDPNKTVTGNPLFCGDSILFCINSQIYAVGKERKKASLLLPEKILPKFDTSVGRSNYDSVLKAKDYDAR